MEDFEIVEMYWDRDENAITETDRKYGKYCRKIAFSIVTNKEDMEECVNDTYLQTWNSLPPQRPERLSTYLGKICRNISINLYEKLTAEKRGGNETDACLDELSELIGGSSEVEEQLDLTVRTVFVQRYWYMMSVKEIAKENRMSDSNVKMTLSRTRDKLKVYLEEEGYCI